MCTSVGTLSSTLTPLSLRQVPGVSEGMHVATAAAAALSHDLDPEAELEAGLTESDQTPAAAVEPVLEPVFIRSV